MGLLDEVFQKKEATRRVRTVKSAPTKKVADKSTRTTTEKSVTSQSTNNPFFDSLKRVQGALSPASKTKSAPKQDVKRNKTTSVTPAKLSEKEKIKDKEKDKAKDKEKERKPWFRSPSRSNLKKDIKSSSTSLNVGGGASNQKVIQDIKKKRPVSVITDSNVTFRRGQTAKIDGQHLSDNLSRASSVTNLDADPKSGKGARPRKSPSRDRIDKIGDGKKNDKKEISRNNNKLDSGGKTYPSVDSLTEEELLHLRRQLQDMAQEKTNLALQLGEQKGQLNILQKEIQKLKEESNIQLEHLTEENTALRNRLRDVAHSPLSDNEKQQLLFDSHRHHSSAPASIATNIIDDGNGADTACTTPDWDKHSSSNVSEVSVACLQDKINQMQETHYSTNEELQATLQELTDLQRQLTELQQENERLNEEKTLMFDSLCRQTERLNDSRSEVESLKQLLYQEKDDTGQFESAVEREQKLVDLLKSAQEEREGLLVKLEQLNNELQETRSAIIDKDEQINQLKERVGTLECTLDAKHAEHKLLDQELAQAKDQCSGKHIEINTLTDLLDNARTKINELEQDRALSDKSELDELLDNARKEKDSLESEVAHLKEQLAISKNEIEKLREQVSILQEECKVTRNNAKTTQSDLEYKCEKLVKEKNVLNEQLQEFQEALNELQVQSQCQLEDKRQLSAVLSETQRNLSEAERKNLALENEVEEIKRLRAEENDEWEKFQDDLLTSVRVANDFKTEAQQELQRMILENKSYRDRERQLKAEIEKLKGGTLKSEADKENMDFLVKRPNKSKTKPRKESGTIGTTSSGSKSDKAATLPQNVPVKRRENKSLKTKRLKTLSVEEEMLLNSLDSYYKDIDQTVPDEFLTEEQKVIRKLKIIYEDDVLKMKPIAPKPKDQLAISKPLLDSVLTNPKLMKILRNPKVKTIEDMATFEKEAPEIRNLIRDIDRSKRGQSDQFNRHELTKRISIIGRSMSYDQLYEIESTDQKFRLYRTPETEDLTKEESIRGHRRESSLVPSDSVSNYQRRSDSSLLDTSKEVLEDNVKYSTLERIVKSIPKNAPESALTKEQKFAVKLLQALEARKNTLKKSEKAKTLPISIPTRESVLKNPKLKEIFFDPNMPDVVRRKSDTHTSPPIKKITRTSKSYNNINFTFEDKQHSVNVFHSSSESSSDSSSSGEFNVETGQTGPFTPLSSWMKPAGIPVSSRNVEMVTFGRNNSARKEKNEAKFKADLLKKDLSALSPQKQSAGRGNGDSVTPEKKQKVKLIIALSSEPSHNDDIKEFSSDADGKLKVDLLQEKIRKKIKKDSPPIEEVISDSPDTSAQILNPDVAISEAEALDSLTYNETLQRVLKRETPVPEEENKKVLEPPPSVDESIRNITEKFQEIRKLISEDQIELRNTSTPLSTEKLDETCTETNPISSITQLEQCINDSIRNSSDYDYHAILKENRVGVTSPLSYRLSYKDVVNEIKTKFVECDPEDESDIEDVDVRTRTVDIDKEMENIIENYLHTRVSQLIKQTEDKPKSSNEAYTSFDKKLNDIVQSSFNSENDELDANADTEADISKHQLMPDDSSLISEQIDSPKISPRELTFSDDSYFELQHGNVTNVKIITENNTGVDELIEATKSFLEDQRKVISPADTNVEEPTEPFEEMENKMISQIPDENEIFTDEELDVVRRARRQTFPRPLSEINELDLQLVQTLSSNYLDEPQSQTEDVFKRYSNTISIDDKNQQHIEDLSDIKGPNSYINQKDLEIIEKLTKEYFESAELDVKYTYGDKTAEEAISFSTNKANEEKNEDQEVVEEELPSESAPDVEKPETSSRQRPLSNINQELIEKVTEEHFEGQEVGKEHLPTNTNNKETVPDVEQPQKPSRQRPHSNFNRKDLELIDKVTKEHFEHHELLKEQLPIETDDNETAPDVEQPKKPSRQRPHSNFNQKDLELIDKVTKEHFEHQEHLKEQLPIETDDNETAPDIEQPEKHSRQRPLSNINQKDLEFIEKATKEHFGRVKEHLPIETNDNETSQDVEQPEKPSRQRPLSNINQKDLEFIEKVTKEHFGRVKEHLPIETNDNETSQDVEQPEKHSRQRPLSNINQKDLEFIEKVTKEHFGRVKEHLPIETNDNETSQDVEQPEKHSRQRPLSNINQKDLEFIEKATKEHFGRVKEHLPIETNDNETSQDVEQPEKPSRQRPLSNINQKDLEFIEKATKEHFGRVKEHLPIETNDNETSQDVEQQEKPSRQRPLSNINQKDLELIEKLTKEYFEDIKDEKSKDITDQRIVQPVKDPSGKIRTSPTRADPPDDLDALLDKMSSSRSQINRRGKNESSVSLFKSDTGNETKENVEGFENSEASTEKTDERGFEAVVKTNVLSPMHNIMYRNNKPRSQTLSQIVNTKIDISKNRLSLNVNSQSNESESKRDRRVKSFAQHFERLSQARSTYSQQKNEPVPLNGRLQARKHLPEVPPMETIDAPVPMPRTKNQATKDPVGDDAHQDDKNNEVLTNMSEYEENFSGNAHNLQQDLSGTSVASGAKVKMPEKGAVEVPGLHESRSYLLDDYNSDSTDEEDITSVEEEGLIRKSDKFGIDHTRPTRTEHFFDQFDTNDGAKSSYSVIAVAGTAEKLDLRKASNITIEPSSLNLFNLDSPGADERYMDVSKIKFEKKKTGYVNATYGEASDAGGREREKKLELEWSDSKPKIVDFVPLDDATKPYYKNNHIPDYNTIEREKTYQVLNAAPAVKIGADADDTKRIATSKVDNDNRSSFTTAKKLFQDLEAKSDQVGVKRVSVMRKKSKDLFDNVDFMKNVKGEATEGSGKQPEIDEI